MKQNNYSIEKDQKETFSFVDKENIKWEIEAKITHRNNYNEFTMSGNGMGHGGQIYDHITPDNEYQQELIDIWKEWHLNGTEKPLPEDFWEVTILEMIQNIEELEEEKFNGKLVSDCTKEEIEELLIEYEGNKIALALHLELTIEELDDITNCDWGYGNCSYIVQGTEYYSGDEEEITEATTEYIGETLWAFNTSFLGDYGALADMDYSNVGDILTPLRQQYESGNDAIRALVDWDENSEEIVEDAISADGIGHFLNGYDGNYDEYEVNGVNYTVCQH